MKLFILDPRLLGDDAKRAGITRGVVIARDFRRGNPIKAEIAAPSQNVGLAMTAVRVIIV